ncbi:aspartate-semialdehyde dehydrogenase [Mesobaculum littorinae]|uniref:Aspartate-semialdehyde dehydrogenase n=1 Tax=Mesobaculum littorinae TaxID=2486419 RepID=A0A438AL17_9RHOB|nr:Rho termination factor N-terminal domain-containing protein [Mesobaculum littorinae]RVV99360.1 aspartate-semialdehyde dehydrogenase [Mesobaculum littorinae]
MASADRTHPELWDEVKDEIRQGGKGGKPGQWSARKAQMAVQEYKRRGGGYDDSGPAQDETHLHQWTEEDWGTKSGRESGDSGERYLPKLVRLLLTEEEYDRTTATKRGGKMQFVDQPKDIRDKAAKIRNDGPTLEMLHDRASELKIEGRSDMSKDALLKAIEDATDENGRALGSAAALEAMTRDALYELAQDRDIEGRSDMTKSELVSALKDQA